MKNITIFLLLTVIAITTSCTTLPEYPPEVVNLTTGFKFTEGPALAPNGDIYFTDIRNSRIHIWSADGKLSTFRENSGEANGLMFDSADNLLVCEGGNRRVTSINPDGKVTLLADSYGGKKLNSPNDLWLDPKGGIYFTDPRYGKQDNLEQDGMHVYYIYSDRKKVVRIIDDMVRPNGIIGTPDGKTLYVTDHGGKKTFAYDIKDDGTLSGRRLVALEGSDGMALDRHGNLYLTTATVTVYSPDGKFLKKIEVPERPANVCFGRDGKTLFITARTSLYAIRLDI